MVKKAKEKDKKAVKKIKEKVDKRDNKGRFKKGTGGGPGRTKGDPKDIISKDGKKRSTVALIDDLLAAYEGMGGDRFLRKWAAQSHRNLSKFMEILFKFAPPPKASSMLEDITYQTSEKYMPKLKIERIITDVNPDDPKAANKRIKDLEDKLREKDRENERLRATIHNEELEELKHEPIEPKKLPEHDEDEEWEEIEALEKRKQDLERKIKEKAEK